jgi:hypothetical protein
MKSAFPCPRRAALAAPALTWLIVIAGLAAAACSKGGQAPGVVHPALLAVDVNRDRLLGEVVVPELDHTLGTADALKAEGLLPFGGAELRQMMLARLKIEPALLDLVDTNQPIALAFVARPPAAPGTSVDLTPWVAGAVTIKSLEAAAKVLAAVGTAAETRKEAQRIARPDGQSLWIVRVGTQIVFADTFEALSEAGAHAVVARQTPTAGTGAAGDDVVATLFPPALARQGGGHNGTFKQRALSAYENGLRDGGQTVPPSERAAVDAGLDFFLVPMDETDRMTFTLGLSGERGLGLSWLATPRAGSAFAQRVARRAPYRLPAGVQGRADVVSLLGLGAMPAWPALVQAIVDKQAAAQVPGAAGVAARLRVLLPLLSGAINESTRAGEETMAVDWIVGLGPAVAPAAATDALAALVADPAFAEVMQQVWGHNPARIATKRKDAQLEITFTFPEGGRASGGAGLARALSGSNALTWLAQAGPGRLVLSSEPGAADRQRALVAAALTTPGSGGGTPLGAAAGETGGKEALIYFDLWGFARPILRAALAGNQRRFMDMMLAIPGLSSMSLPVWLSLDGGEAFVADLRVPVATLRNGSLLLNLLGGGGGTLPQLP